MLVIGLITWWYGAGWMQLAQRLLQRIGNVTDFFSIALLFKTLFAPYRQISAGRVQGPVGMQLRAWFDLQVSRVIGALVRLSVIIFGLVATTAMLLCALFLMVSWPLVPVLPLITLVIVLGGGA